jgi:hypothetical protein
MWRDSRHHLFRSENNTFDQPAAGLSINEHPKERPPYLQLFEQRPSRDDLAVNSRQPSQSGFIATTNVRPKNYRITS